MRTKEEIQADINWVVRQIDRITSNEKIPQYAKNHLLEWMNKTAKQLEQERK